MTTTWSACASELLASPVGHEVSPDAARARLAAGIGEAVSGAPRRAPVEVTRHALAGAAGRPAGIAPHEPFRWKPAFVRRSLGLAAVRACADGRWTAPAAAVAPLAEEAVARWHATGDRTFHWEPWLAGLAPGARAVVLAEATTWATPVWTALPWASLGDGARIGGPDDQWTCPAPRQVRLRGRAEARVAVGGAGGAAEVQVVVLAGRPQGSWREELAFPALVAGLRWPARPVPARVVGLWPEASEVRTADVDTGLLVSTADRVVEVVRSAFVGAAAV